MRMPWESRDYDDAAEWQPSQSGPEYHLNKNAPPRCLRNGCGMPMRLFIDEQGPIWRCQSKRCDYEERP
jgi:hypothetical protein